MRKTIVVNENYEIEYRYSKKNRDYEDFNRLNVVVLLSKKKGDNRVILRADNCDKKTSKWLTHIHKPNSNNRIYFHYVGGSLESNWNDFKSSFLNESIKLIGEDYKKDLESALEQLKFVFD